MGTHRMPPNQKVNNETTTSQSVEQVSTPWKLGKQPMTADQRKSADLPARHNINKKKAPG